MSSDRRYESQPAKHRLTDTYTQIHADDVRAHSALRLVRGSSSVRQRPPTEYARPPIGRAPATARRWSRLARSLVLPPGLACARSAVIPPERNAHPRARIHRCSGSAYAAAHRAARPTRGPAAPATCPMACALRPDLLLRGASKPPEIAAIEEVHFVVLIVKHSIEFARHAVSKSTPKSGLSQNGNARKCWHAMQVGRSARLARTTPRSFKLPPPAVCPCSSTLDHHTSTDYPGPERSRRNSRRGKRARQVYR